MRPSAVLIALVAALLIAARRPAGARLLRWLPIPLWCYSVPMVLREAGWLPAPGAYAWIQSWVLPLSLALLLLGVDLASVSRVGMAALRAMLVGALAIVFGGPVLLVALKQELPADAWQGIGVLAATWTGGSLNMVAVQAMLNTPESVFAPLVIVDAIVAYGWMACLVAAKGAESRINRWLRAETFEKERCQTLLTQKVSDTVPRERVRRFAWMPSVLMAAMLTLACRWAASRLPLGTFMASATGWTVLLVTSLALAGSSVPGIRRAGRGGAAWGYPCLYLVLASLGAQANLSALVTAPGWLLAAAAWLAIHAAALLVAGRVWRLPMGVLATASQANIGGVVSAPLVGAVYEQRLAAVGLVLAVAGNAVGTYLGLASAALARFLYNA